MYKLFISLAALAALNPATADVITSDYTDITSQAQSYSKSFSLSSSYENVMLKLTAKGDFGQSLDENIKFSIDGYELLDWSYNTSGISVTENYLNYDYTLQGTVAISSVLWDSFATDSILNISWQLGSNVYPYPVLAGSDYVKYEILGDVSSVPVPAAAWMFMPALLGLIGFRHKAKQSKT